MKVEAFIFSKEESKRRANKAVLLLTEKDVNILCEKRNIRHTQYMEPKESKKGFFAKTQLVDESMIRRMILMAIPMAIGTLFLFGQYYQDDLAKAWTISLTTLAVFQWFSAWNFRSSEQSIFSLNPFSNRFLVGATVTVIVLQWLAVYHPLFQKVLKNSS